MRMRASVSGTCLTQTAIFIPSCLSTRRARRRTERTRRRDGRGPGHDLDSPRSLRSYSAFSALEVLLAFEAAEEEGPVGAPEAEGVRQGVADVGLAGRV